MTDLPSAPHAVLTTRQLYILTGVPHPGDLVDVDDGHGHTWTVDFTTDRVVTLRNELGHGLVATLAGVR